MPVSLRTRSSVVKEEPKDVEDDEIVAPQPKRRAKAKSSIPEEISSPPNRNVEEIRRKNLEDNKAFLEGLLMTKIRDDFKSSSHSLQPTIKREAKKRDVKFVTVTENVPVRRSRRLANLDVHGNKLPTPEQTEDETENQQPKIVVKRVYRRLPSISAEEQEEINEKIRKIFDHDEQNIEKKPIRYEFTDLNIHDENVLKLTPDRLIDLDIHPRSDTIAIVGCDRRGTIGLVTKSTNDLQGMWAKINYDFHNEYATCCSFDRFQSHCVLSTSYDATLRTCDITKKTFPLK